VTYDSITILDFDHKKHSSIYVKLHNDGQGFDFKKFKKKITVSSFDENIKNVFSILLKDATKHTKCIGFVKVLEEDKISKNITIDFATDEDFGAFKLHGKSMLCAAIELFVGRLNNNKIIIQEDIDNSEKVNIIKNCGFVPEVRRRKHQLNRGRYSTVIDFAFFAREEF
jgi:hypothetical protein